MIIFVWMVVNLIVFHFLIWRQIRQETASIESVRVSWKFVIGIFGLSKFVYLILSWVGGELNWVNLTDGGYNLSIGFGVIWLFLWIRFKKYKSKWQNGWDDILSESLVIFYCLESMRLVFVNPILQNWINLLILGLIVGFIFWVKPRYRRFKLYSSGKSGFIFWTSWIIINIYEIINYVKYSNWAVLINLLIGLCLGIFATAGWYKRAGRKVSKDWPWLYYWFK